jgi:subtilase family serine protease
MLGNAGTTGSQRSPRTTSARARRAALTTIMAMVTLAGLSAAGVTGGAGLSRTAAGPAVAAPDGIQVINAGAQFPAPISTTDCVAEVGIRCYTPVQYRKAYNLNRLYRQGITGAGRTIVIVDSFGSPTIASDLKTFDAEFGLPNPHLKIEQFGAIPPFDPANSTMVGWAFETTLDVEYAHSIAPGAKIVLAETPDAEVEGTSGFPQMMNAERALINRGVGDVISQSFGATENTFPGFSQGNFASLLGLRYAFKDALAHHVTVVAGSGDTGATSFESDAATLYPFRVNSWPSSDPLVTSVGGTMLDLDNNGRRLSPDTVWNDGAGAGGGGKSAVFGRPPFQARVAGVVGSYRGTPDISMTAAVNGAAWVYGSFLGTGDPGWTLVGGTSEATPIFAGVVALADQLAGHRLGWINPDLYALGALSQRGGRTGIVDVTADNNTFAGVTGFDATPGYDLASGWGTINGYQFVRALARF